MFKKIPNILTLSRIGVIPFLIASFYMEGVMSHRVAAAIFLIASITDFFDGHLARTLSAQTSLGKFLDPMADKLLVASAIIMLVYSHAAPVIPAIAIIIREILVSGLREYLAEIRVSLPVSQLGKIKTAMQMISIFLLLLGSEGSGVFYTEILGSIALWFAALLTLISGYAYLKAGLMHFDQTPGM